MSAFLQQPGQHAVPRRDVYSRIEMEVQQPARIFAQIAVAEHPGAELTEKLVITRDGQPIEPQVIQTPHRGRLHRFRSHPGHVVIEYSASITGQADTVAAEPLDDALYLRPSRYAESDELLAKAYEEFTGVKEPRAIFSAITEWVSTHLSYVPGSSGPSDGAGTTLLHRQGVCRDYAHLTTALLRALDVPARVVGVYAPGISPMDFHAVTEALVDGEWIVADSTRLGPRQSMVRMVTGRDAADTAFLSTYEGFVDLKSTRILATVDGDLPVDDHTATMQLR
ncbi:transglutaminase-like domain-containing protein [Hoyosella subflava]|uniref:Transglutaminase domain protein n=1 Tax=Hoyosella subflava (strain DSM 45089 / JCM 17490 / NBRC 109087 / DQS3-9A1) TaxID=443218 RepID=F6EKR0_HOYSD|nr:transglutaminase domain-containing protein [Hoyosella subflava]AEF40196.1 Transglutaminase domain protein [Hoyosella subflava DQS3-9A1]